VVDSSSVWSTAAIDRTSTSTINSSGIQKIPFQESSKVLDEIMDLIFEAIPPEKRAGMRAFSHRWKELIKKIRYHIKHDWLLPPHEPVNGVDAQTTTASHPAEINSSSLQFYPMVSRYRDCQAYLLPDKFTRDYNKNRYPAFLLRCVNDRALLVQHQTALVKKPPITTLALAMETRALGADAVVRVPDGIWIIHLLEIVDRIIAQEVEFAENTPSLALDFIWAVFILL
jgi:hypothetical protein